MSAWRRSLRRFFAFIWRSRAEAELSREVDAHLALIAADYRQRGLSDEEARRAARRAFGGVEQAKDRQRDARSFAWLEDLRLDVRDILRRLRQSPVFTLVAILSLALGLGAMLTLFGLINGLLLRELPVRDPAQLVEVTTIRQGHPARLSLPMLAEIGERQRVLSGVFAWWGGGIFTTQVGQRISPADIWAVSGNFFSELGTSPAIGRLLQSDDVNIDAPPAQVAVLGYSYWQRMFGGDPAAVGEQVDVEGVPFVIVGVTRPGFRGMGIDSDADVILPLTAELLMTPQTPEQWRAADHLWLSVGGRRKPGVSLAAARAQLETVWPAILASTVPPDRSPIKRTDFMALRLQVSSGATGEEGILRNRFTGPLLGLMSIAGLILLVACLNLAGLMLARATARSQELKLRIALGAGRGRLVRQALMEAFIVALAGTGAALWLAGPAGTTIRNFMMAGFLTPPALNVGADLHVVAVAAGLTCLTAIICAAGPAWYAGRQQAGALCGRGAAAAAATGWSGRLLVAAQIVLSMVLLVTGGLFVRSLQKIRSVDPGFSVSNRVSFTLTPLPGGYKHIDKDSYYRELLEKVSAVPGVKGASLAHLRPLMPQPWRVAVWRQTDPADHWMPAVDLVSPEFFHTMTMRLLAGRRFQWSDDGRAPRIAIVSRTLARKIAPDGRAIGAHLHVQTIPGLEAVTVVGIVSDARLYDLRNDDLDAIYIPFLQVPSYTGWPSVIVEAKGSPAAVLSPVSEAIEALGHEYPLYTLTLGEAEDRALLEERMMAFLGAFFAGLALLLAGIGLYGLMSYTVTRRTRELGIQLALGATGGMVVRTVVWDTLKLVLTGAAAGLPCALAAGYLAAHLLFGLSPDDPLTLAVVSLALALTGVLAGYLPARRAARIDPMVALRSE